MIITQISRPTGRLTLATSMPADRLEEAGQHLAERDADDDAQKNPDGQVALEDAHGRRRTPLQRRGWCEVIRLFHSAAADLGERRLQRGSVHRLQRQRQQLQHAIADRLACQLECATLALSPPSALDGSGYPQCTLTGSPWPPKNTGHASAAALSHTVITMDSGGASARS